MKEISPDNPLRNSKWLWPEGEMYLNNCQAQYRYDFEMKEVPEKAPLYITADQSYRLYINGGYVCRGPARGYQSHWPLDEVDVSQHLRTGHNFISVEAYNPGIGTFQYLHLYNAGFICAADWGNVKINTNKATWQMRRSPANRQYIARLSKQMGFQEDFDASKDDLSWIYSDTPPQWVEAEMFRWFGEIQYGRAPWNTLEERAIPMLRENTFAPEKITVHGTGNMKPGWRDCFNIAWQWVEEEAESVKEWLSAEELQPQKTAEGLTFNVDPVDEGKFHAVVIDLGAISIGTFELELSNCKGDEIADCLYFQYLEDGIPQDLLPVGVGHISLATRLRAAAGNCRRMFYQVEGAKYIVLVFRNLSQKLGVKTLWRNGEYPFAMRGQFETSEKLLNDIHSLCRHTQQICSSDAYMDTPWREQGQWWGDARIQGKNTFYLDGDARILRRGIYSIAGQKTENGLTYGVAPCSSGGCILPDFSLTWVLTVYDYYWQTGELDVFHDQHERIKQVLAYFDSTDACGENGLLKHDARFWLFEDWAELPKRGYPTFLNLWHIYTLQHYEKLLAAAGLEDEAKAVSEKCAKKLSIIETELFDEEQGLFVSGRELDGNVMAEPPSLHDQTLAILIGAKSELHDSIAQKRLLPFLRREKTDYAVPTSFWCTYLFDAAKQLGYNKEVLEFIRSGWGKMIPSGGTWEHFIWDRSTGQSCCHAWSSHPASHLVDILGGIRQLSPQWREIECSPKSELLTESGRILLPLPLGDLVLEWNEKTINLAVPNFTTVKFTWNGSTTELTNGKHEIKRDQ